MIRETFPKRRRLASYSLRSVTLSCFARVLRQQVSTAGMDAKTLKYSKAEEKKHLNVRARLSHMATVRDPLCCFKNELTPHSSVGHICLILKFLLREASPSPPPQTCVLLPEHGVHVSSGSPEVDTNNTPAPPPPSQKKEKKKVQTQPTLAF